MNTMLKLQIEELGDAVPKLGTSSDFARSLCAQYWNGRRPLSEKQVAWVGKLLERARKMDEPKSAEQIGDVRGVLDLFDKARAHLKWPAIVLAIRVSDPTAFAESQPHLQLHNKQMRNGTAIYYFLARLSVAGERARVPGSINVTSYEQDQQFGRRRWFGRVLRDGTFEPSENLPDGMTKVLEELAARPAEMAAAHGKLTGRCCFCNTALSDERSTAVGYGRTCAGHYGQPWGERPDEFAGAA